MRFLIIAAMEEEAIEIKKIIGDETNVKIVTSGIGKVNAAITTTKNIIEFNPDIVINTGSAGAINKDLSIGDVIVATGCIYHDVDVTHFGYEIGQVPQMDKVIACDCPTIEGTRKGLIISGDQFVSKNALETIMKNFGDAMCVEMEATAIAHTCQVLNKKCIIVRSISDNPHKEGNNMDFKEFLQIAAKNSAKIVEEIIRTKNIK